MVIIREQIGEGFLLSRLRRKHSLRCRNVSFC
jgi:hypothetical protein